MKIGVSRFPLERRSCNPKVDWTASYDRNVNVCWNRTYGIRRAFVREIFPTELRRRPFGRTESAKDVAPSIITITGEQQPTTTCGGLPVPITNSQVFDTTTARHGYSVVIVSQITTCKCLRKCVDVFFTNTKIRSEEGRQQFYSYKN